MPLREYIWPFQLQVHTTHLVWRGKSGVQGSFCVLPQSTVVFASLHIVIWIKMILPVCHTDWYMSSQNPNSALSSSLSSLSNRICRGKKKVLSLRNVAWCSFLVTSACNLLNQTYILTANVKFPPCQHTNKITLIHLKLKNSIHKPNVN